EQSTLQGDVLRRTAMTVEPSIDRAPQQGISLGIVQNTPTQFDEPLFRYLTAQSRIRLVVYYYAASDAVAKQDPEIGRQVGWNSHSDRGYAAEFSPEAGPLRFARRVVNAGHDLIVVFGYNERPALCTAVLAKARGIPVGLRSDNILPANGGRLRHWKI